MEVGESFGVIATVITIALALGGGVVVFRSSAVKSSYNALRQHVDDLEGRVDYLEKENSRLKGEMKRMTKDFARELSKEVAPALISEMERRGVFNGRS